MYQILISVIIFNVFSVEIRKIVDFKDKEDPLALSFEILNAKNELEDFIKNNLKKSNLLPVGIKPVEKKADEKKEGMDMDAWKREWVAIR